MSWLAWVTNTERLTTLRSPRWTRLVLALVVVLACLPALESLAEMATQTWREPLFESDTASIEIGLRQFLRMERAVGVYSRFGWSHPGPALFAFLAPAYLVSGGASASLLFTTVLTNLICIILAVLLGRRIGGPFGAIATASIAVIVQAALGRSALPQPWPPYWLVLPVFLFLVVSSLLALEGFRWFASTLLLGSILVQVHLGTAPLVALVISAASLAFLLAARLRREPAALSALRERRSMLCLVLVGLAWLPPLYENFLGPLAPYNSGNLSRIRRTVTGRTTVGPEVGWELTSRSTSTFFSAATGTESQPNRSAISTLVIGSSSGPDRRATWLTAAVLLVLVLSLTLREWRSARSLAMAGVAIGTTFWTASSIVGAPYAYLVAYGASVGGFACLAIAWAIQRIACSRLSARGSRGVGIACLLLLLAGDIGAWKSLKDVPSMPPRTALHISRLSSAAIRARERRAMPCIRIGAADHFWPAALGVFLELEKHGERVLVDDSLRMIVGPTAFSPEPTCLDLRVLSADAPRSWSKKLASTAQGALVVVPRKPS